MKKLGKRNYLLISKGINTLGTYNPDEILFLFEEDLLINEVKEIILFLKWCHNNNKSFNKINYEKVFQEFILLK